LPTNETPPVEQSSVDNEPERFLVLLFLGVTSRGARVVDDLCRREDVHSLDRKLAQER